MTLEEFFGKIKTYHDKLEDKATPNDIVLAIHAEVSELLESYSWKPWRPSDYNGTDYANMIEELVDILFFIGRFMEMFKIEHDDIECMFNQKLIENYARIERGYNNARKGNNS